MLTAKDIMTTKPVTVTPETEVGKAAELMLQNHFNGLPVVSAAGKLVGVITQSDLVGQQKKFKTPSIFTLLDGYISFSSEKSLEKEIQRMTAATVGQAMSDDPVFVAADATLENIASLMVDEKLHTLPVVDSGLLIGIIGKEDVLRTLIASKSQG